LDPLTQPLSWALDSALTLFTATRLGGRWFLFFASFAIGLHALPSVALLVAGNYGIFSFSLIITAMRCKRWPLFLYVL
jgi:hypothetical protein